MLSVHGESRKPASGARAALNLVVIGLTAFLTVVDLFATQAILPLLTEHYGVSPAAMGTAVNAATLGMAISGILVAVFSRRIPRRAGILVSLACLSVPTALLAHAPDLATFFALRVVQGLFMAAAFTLTLAHLGERCAASASASAFAAYITGNVASNLVGRLLSAGAADEFGLAWTFYLFAALNLAGAGLVFATISRAPPVPGRQSLGATSLRALGVHLANPSLRITYAIGFLILFAFIGTFTYVNFVLVRPPINLGMMALGSAYLVFAPSILTTPLAGRLAQRLGPRLAMQGGLLVALAGLVLLLVPSLPAVLAGMVLVAIGTFFAQANATGFVGRAATADRGAASGLYLASYFLGGMTGSAVLGQLFDRFGWTACVAGIGAALLAGIVLAAGLKLPGTRGDRP
ncbi:MAG: MFS transporter [Alphaproteobacteria bacterium]|nr:MFS transporter [Alphaproteobacteria bacterium]